MASCRHCCLGTATEVTVGVIEKIILSPLMLYYFDCLFNMFDIKKYSDISPNTRIKIVHITSDSRKVKGESISHSQLNCRVISP